MQIIFISIQINCSSQITRKFTRVAGPLQSRGTTNYGWDHNIWLQGPLFKFRRGSTEDPRAPPPTAQRDLLHILRDTFGNKKNLVLTKFVVTPALGG